MELNFSCPEFYYGQDLYKLYFELERQQSKLLYPNRKIHDLFGCFPNMIWNGGSYVLNCPINIADIEYYANFYKDNGTIIRLTLTNPNLKPSDCFDRYCNLIVEAFHNELNEITISSPVLEEYIRKTYPKFKINRSIIATKDDPRDANFYEQLLEKYNNVVLPRRFIKDLEFLDTIRPELRSRVELLCNDPCPANCPRIYEHYSAYANVQLYIKNANVDCVQQKFSLDDHILASSKFIEDQITENGFDDYINLGYNNYKISGRSSDRMALCNTAKYFIKPEYLYNFINWCVFNIIK